jgi:acetolactate synthase-1/2/3 large subunit
MHEGLAADTAPRREIRSRVAALRKKYEVYDEPKTRLETSPLSQPRMFKILRERLPRETLVVSDAGVSTQFLKRNFPVYAKDGFFGFFAAGVMGSGLPMAHGVQLARPDSPVLNLIGDGGFLVHASELSVAAEHDLPVIHVVVQNGGYAQVSDRLVQWYKHGYGCAFKNPSYPKLAESFGCDGYLATNGQELAQAVDRALARRRPTVIEVPVEGDNMLDLMPASIRALCNDLYKDPPSGWPFPRG